MKHCKSEYDFNGTILRADPEAKIVTFGKWVWDRPRFIAKAEDVIFLAEMAQGPLPDVEGKYYDEKVNKAFTKALGITPSKFKGIWNSVMLSVWVDPIKEQVYRYAFERNLAWHNNKNHLQLLWRAKDLVLQCEADGNHHIAPFVWAFQRPPQELKKILGKGLWKRLCKNSLSRNLCIAKHLEVWYFDSLLVGDPYEQKKNIEVLNLFPSRALKWGRVRLDNLGLWAAKQSKHHQWDNLKYGRLVHLAVDTRRMANSLGEPFSFEWSAEEMEERHGRYTRLRLSGQYSKTPFEVLKDNPLKELHGRGGWTAHLLMSPYEVAEEGRAMRHCVASYLGNVSRGEYLVYSIRKDGKRSSTLGVRLEKRSEGDRWTAHQHYGLANKIVPHDEEQFGLQVVAELRSRLSGELQNRRAESITSGAIINLEEERRMA